MPPDPYPTCTDVDYDIPTEVDQVYGLYLAQYSQAERDAFKAQAEVEMFNRMQQIYGTNNWQVVIANWALDPQAVIDLSPNYGFSHAAQLLTQLIQDSTVADEKIKRYFVREAQARCAGDGGDGPYEEWLNPTVWSEDSRLDYFTPLLFAEWYL